MYVADVSGMREPRHCFLFRFKVLNLCAYGVALSAINNLAVIILYMWRVINIFQRGSYADVIFKVRVNGLHSL
jgi:hypothetical protein